MNSEFPEAPEDRLLDELLLEQNHGPDEAFLRQIEAAVDTQSFRAAPPSSRSFARYAVAASVALAAGGVLWWGVSGRSPSRAVAVLESRPVELAERVHAEKIVVEAAPAPITRDEEASHVVESKAEATRILEKAAPVDKTPIASTRSAPRLESALESIGDELRPSDGGTLIPRAKPRDIGSKMFGDAAAPSRAREDISVSSDHDAVSGDRYGKFIDQPWRSSEHDPLSTFSINVDTASYGNVRRMIREGRDVPRDAVRIEECVNAFSYNYQPPKGDGPFAVGATVAVCPWDPNHQLVRVAIKGREIEAAKRPASNLVFLIDVSGSMSSPDRLPLLKKSMATLAGELDERDRVAIVVYAGNEGVALPSTRLDADGKAKVLKVLSKLEAGGSTNGGAGIKRAYELAMKDKVEGGVNRVILATDGDFNVGVTGQKQLVDLVKDRAKSGVYLTVLGVGTGNFNDSMMDAITHDGNGNYFYIDSEREGRKVLSQNLTGTLVTIAKDVKIQVEFNPAKVGNYRLIGYSNRVLKNEDFNNDKVDAGEIGAGHTVTAFYELAPAGESATDTLKYQAAPVKPATGNEWLTVKLRYKHPDGDESSRIEFPLTGEALSVDHADTDFQFASAVALFGMKLRGMDEVRNVGWSKVVELAQPALKDDRTEDRAEFVNLVYKLGDSLRDRPSRNLESRPEDLENLRGMRDKEFGDGFGYSRLLPPLPSVPKTGQAEVMTPNQEADIVPPVDAGGEFNAVDGPNVRVIRHEDGSRSVFVRSPNNQVLTQKTFTRGGVLETITIYRMDQNENPLSGKIFDGLKQELFKIRYGYRKSDGHLVEEQMFDSRQKNIDETGAEIPVRRLIYTYDAEGKRNAPMSITLKAGKTAQEVYKGGDNFVPESNPFRQKQN